MSNRNPTKKLGRPAIEIDQGVIEKAEKLAAQGLTLNQISSVLGFHTSTLCEKQNDFPELKEAIKRGRAKGIGIVTNALFEKAKGGDNISMIFYLKNRDRDNWNDRHVVETKSINYNVVIPDDPIAASKAYQEMLDAK